MTDTETTPNIERIRQLADFISELDDEQFSLDIWIRSDPRPVHFMPQRNGSYRYRPDHTLEEAVNECGTVACIGGYAVLLFGNQDLLNPPGEDDATEDYADGIGRQAQELLGLSDRQAERLFHPYHGNDLRDELHIPTSEVTPGLAAAVLYEMVESYDHDFSWNNHCMERCCFDDGDYEDDDDEEDENDE